MSATPPAATGRRGRHPHLLLLGLGLGLASLLASPAAAYLCTEEPPAVRKQEGETCGGACFSEGICADGLVCGPSPADAAFLAAAPENAKIRDFVDHVLGRAATGVCVPPQAAPVLAAAPEAVRELREGRALPTAGADGRVSSAAAPCVGCPTGIDPTGEYVVQAAEAAVQLMAEGGFFAEAAPGEKFTLVRVVSGTSQVVSGIRYDLVIAVKRSNKPGATEYYRIDVVSQPWVDPPHRLLAARPLTAQEAAEVEAGGFKKGGAGGGGSKGRQRGLLAAAGDAIRRAAARLR